MTDAYVSINESTVDQPTDGKLHVRKSMIVAVFLVWVQKSINLVRMSLEWDLGRILILLDSE